MASMRMKKVAKIESSYVREQEYAEYTTARKRKLLIRRLGIFLVFAAVFSYFMISNILSQTAALNGKIEQKKQLEKELSGLKDRQDMLKEDIVKLNDNDYIAKLARKEYFLSQKNEIIFNLPKDGQDKSSDK
ncbi:MAG: septum formation initiator family protein [Bacillota bacterium]|nr:septum formation initiator family protein [Bacillota bacterium]